MSEQKDVNSLLTQLSEFAKSNNNIVSLSNNSKYFSRKYSQKEISNIIDKGTLSEQIALSRYFFDRDGFYSRIIFYYATLLTYSGVLIPNPRQNSKITDKHVKKKYKDALDFLTETDWNSILVDWSIKVIRDGRYYGIRVRDTKKEFHFIDLPYNYCEVKYKDLSGNDVITFDLKYFDSIRDADEREALLNAYPAYIKKEYIRLAKVGGRKFEFNIPSEDAICFSMFKPKPLFLNVIPAAVDYSDTVDTEKEKDKEEIKKILVQEIPHLSDGTLLFSPPEAQQIHKGTVNMLKGNSNMSVLTTYANASVQGTRSGTDITYTNLDKMANNIYSQAGTSNQLFASSGNLSLETSLNNDLSLMMTLANKYSIFISNVLNELFGNVNLLFKYIILPISTYNRKEYIDNAFKMANGGYSLLVPAIAMGLNQRELGNLKDLENELLNIKEKLIPIDTAYTQSSSGEAGRKEKPDSEKSEKTIENLEGIDKAK